MGRGQERPEAAWEQLDACWKAAFSQAWEALRTGNIPVGACISTREGEIVHAARNRVMDGSGPAGETWGSALSHAEVNALARVGFRQHSDLVLTTTLEPCLQCAAAIRLAPVTTVRFAGADSYWAGCHDFGRLSAREAGRRQPRRVGPRSDELGLFATVISRVGPALSPRYEEWLRQTGEGALLALARRLSRPDEVTRLASYEVGAAFARLYPELTGLRAELSAGAS